jgi:hypothetical protein
VLIIFFEKLPGQFTTRCNVPPIVINIFLGKYTVNSEFYFSIHYANASQADAKVYPRSVRTNAAVRSSRKCPRKLFENSESEYSGIKSNASGSLQLVNPFSARLLSMCLIATRGRNLLGRSVRCTSRYDQRPSENPPTKRLLADSCCLKSPWPRFRRRPRLVFPASKATRDRSNGQVEAYNKTSPLICRSIKLFQEFSFG